MPELMIPGPFGRFLRRISRTRPLYWLLITAVVLAVFASIMPPAFWSAIVAGLRAQKYLVAMMGAFGVLAVSLVWSKGQSIDVWVFHLFNTRGERPRWLDYAMLGFTQLGNGVFAYVVALLFFLHTRHLIAYEVAFGTVTLWLMVELLKVLVQRVRPYKELHGIRIIGKREGGSSFPSGHTSQAFFMASILFHYFDSGIWIAAALYTAALLVGVTRIYVGMHFPRDVLGGLILGTSWGLVGVFINSYIFWELNLR